MYVTAEQIQSGLIRYINVDMLPKVDGWKKVLFGASLQLAGSQNLGAKIMSSPYLDMLGIKTADGMIDIDRLKQAVQHQIGMQKLDIDIPIIGTYKIGQSDIERISQIIKGDDNL